MNLIFSKLGFILAISLVASQFTFAQQTVHRSEEAGLQYLKYLPQDYESGSEDYPLLLFLHGGGETGDNIELVKRHGPPKLIERGKDFPFIIISPQNPENKLWNDAALKELLDEIIDTHRIDESRVYLTGMSRGGFGTWRMAIQNPEMFAAIVPICGGGTPSYAQWLKDVPVWAFHGAKDRVIPLSQTVAMVEALQQAQGNVKLTTYPEAGHDSWTETYDNPEVYDWLLSHRKAGRGKQYSR
ncbi:MAG: prolyl oligopeptidase family serine peptidase [Tunicatimonas sp.]|uniref:carboxylesterase family protein n=1 Tax=Tunicatimonas sp. TaxID=1940096 RepID=UPI003C732950